MRTVALGITLLTSALPAAAATDTYQPEADGPDADGVVSLPLEAILGDFELTIDLGPGVETVDMTPPGGTGTCQPETLTREGLSTWSRDSCPGLSRVTSTAAASLTVIRAGKDVTHTVKLADVVHNLETWTFHEGRLWLPRPPRQEELHLFTDAWRSCTLALDPPGTRPTDIEDGWKAYTCTESESTEQLAYAIASGKGATLRGLTGDTKEVLEHKVEAFKPKDDTDSSEPPEPLDCQGDDACRALMVEAEETDTQLIVIDVGDLTGPGVARVYDGSRGKWRGEMSLIAGRGITIAVYMPKDRTLGLGANGTVGRDLGGPFTMQSLDPESVGKGRSEAMALRVARLVPHQKGQLDLTLTLKKDKDDAPTRTYTFLVERRARAIVRAGVAAGFPFTRAMRPAPYGRYAREVPEGSSTPVVVDQGAEIWLRAELNVGVTLFTKQVDERDLGDYRTGFYLGAGLAKLVTSATESSGTEVFIPSLHVGLDHHLGPGFSVVFPTLTLYAERELSPRHRVGEFATSDPLASRLAPGGSVGLVLNISSASWTLWTKGVTP